MFTKSLLLAGVISTFALSAMAQDVDPAQLPEEHGQIPCNSFVIERIIDGERFVAYPEQEEVTIVALRNNSMFGTSIEIAGNQYNNLRVVVNETGLTCIGTPLDETNTAAGS